MSKRMILAGVVLLASAMPAYAAELSTNGLFENAGARLPGPSAQPVPADPMFTSAPGWSISFPANSLVRFGSANTNYGGTAYLSGSSAGLSNIFAAFGEGQNGVGGTLAQTLGASVGLTTVSFGAGLVGIGNGLQQLTATVSDSFGAVLASTTVNPNFGANWDAMFADYSFNYTGTGSAVTLAFSAFGSDTIDTDILLDNISVTGVEAAADVPEPATWAMMIGGFGMVGFAMRRRAKVAFA